MSLPPLKPLHVCSHLDTLKISVQGAPEPRRSHNNYNYPENNTGAFFPVAGARFAILDLLALRKRQDPQEILPYTKTQAVLLGAQANS